MKNEDDLLKLYDECMEFWGLERQLRMTQEECGELIIAISHFIRGRKNSIDNLIEELADTQLMLNQIIHHVGEDEVKKIIDIKSDYVKRKLEEAKEKANGV
jgi:NTP pyrophosphatase (non-canonical NTP hydrolase)